MNNQPNHLATIKGAASLLFFLPCKIWVIVSNLPQLSLIFGSFQHKCHHYWIRELYRNSHYLLMALKYRKKTFEMPSFFIKWFQLIRWNWECTELNWECTELIQKNDKTNNHTLLYPNFDNQSFSNDDDSTMVLNTTIHTHPILSMKFTKQLIGKIHSKCLWMINIIVFFFY